MPRTVRVSAGLGTPLPALVNRPWSRPDLTRPTVILWPPCSGRSGARWCAPWLSLADGPRPATPSRGG